MAIHISNKIDFNSESVSRDKECHHVMIKSQFNKKIEQLLGAIYIYAPNRAPKYIKEILTDMKGEIEKNTIIVGDFNKSHFQ